MEQGISVVVCTYNGGAKIKETLAHLAKQIVPKNIGWEVLFIDNSSTDNSAAIALETWKEQQIDTPLHIHVENTPGKLFALQKGLSLVKYKYFIICDDDNWLDPTYVATVFNILESNPKIGAVGGQAIAVTESSVPLPDWFKAHQSGYAVGEQGLVSGDVTFTTKHLWGAGLGSRTSLYLDIYKELPSLLLNRGDQSILSTEDTEYCLRLVLKGYKLFYDSSLTLQHYISKGRLTLAYKDKLFKNFDNAYTVMGKYYLAIKLGIPGRLNLFNRVRLTIISPIRFLFTSSKEKKLKQITVLSYLIPGLVKPDPITAQIKKIIPRE